MRRFWGWLMGDPSDIDFLRNRVELLEGQVTLLMEDRNTAKTLNNVPRQAEAASPTHKPPAPQTWRQALAAHERYNQTRED